MEELHVQTGMSDDDWFVFIPDKEVLEFKSIYNRMQQAQQELQKVAEKMRPIENTELRC